LAPHFPHLEILELIGQGGMGAVYRARQRSLDRIVALKVLPPEVGHDPAFAERFGREARALGSLTHPNIVMVFDFGQVSGYFYFVMEYVDGVNLRQSLQTARLTPEQALAIVPQVCEALQYAHDQGIVHRDIKPENVLLDRKGRVKIADFGLAKLLGRGYEHLSLTGTGQVMGTPHYMAPEQMEKPMQVDHRADIYSLGVVFYELLTGELPLGRFAPPSEKSNVSADLDEVVLRTLEKEPGRRYQHASEVKTAVEMLSHEPRQNPRAAAPPVGSPRLRVPFTISDIYGGLARADGILRFDGQTLDLEYQVKDDVLGCVTSDVKHVLIPLQDLLSLNMVPGLLGWRTYLELRTDRLHTLGDVPGKKSGIVRLLIARADVEMARAMSNAVQRALGYPVSAAYADQSGVRPPLPGSQPDGRRIAADVRAPAIGLTVVGILDCLAVLLMFLIVPALTLRHPAQTEVQSVSIPQVTVTDGNSGNQVTVTDGVQRPIIHEELEIRPTSQAVGAPLLLILLPMMLLVLAFPILMIVGAMRMQQLRSYGLAMTASVIAVLPIHPWFILGLPFGVWAIVVLMRRETRDAFHAREISGAGIFGAHPYDDSGAMGIPPKPGAMAATEATNSLRRAGLNLILLAVPTILFCIAGCWQAIAKMPSPQWVLIMAVVPVVAGLFQLKAGICMRQGRCYGLCLVGATLAMLPIGSVWAFTQLLTGRVPAFTAISLTLVWLFGLVSGAWAWYVLTRPENKQFLSGQGFDASDARPPLPYRSGGQSYAFVIPLVIVMLFSLVMIVTVFGMVFWSRTTVIEHQSSEFTNSYPVVAPPPWPEMPSPPEMPAMPELPEASVPAEAAPAPAVPN
jgi:serine/threonine protein kinase